MNKRVLHTPERSSSALDPIAILKIEDLMRSLTEDYTIVIVSPTKRAALAAGEDKAGILVE